MDPPPGLHAARIALRRHFGHPDFRPLQRDIIRDALAGRDTLAILPTGGGKSLCYQLPALLRPGLTIVVSPLISLMEDQTGALRSRGIPAAMLSSAQAAGERGRILRELSAGVHRLLYVSPERLVGLAPRLRESGVGIGLLAVDEAHCIAEWGHDFRPEYRRIRAARVRLGRPPVLALTGTATPEVREDIIASLGLIDPSTHLGSFDRPNLSLHVIRVRDDRERARRMREALTTSNGPSIIYAPTRRLTEAITWRLRQWGMTASCYHAGLDSRLRSETLERFLSGECPVVVATSAFGMGIDKPDVRMVLHWGPPPSPEAYYQQAGRAGRDGAPSRCILLFRGRDSRFHRRQLAVTFPPRRLLERIWSGEIPLVKVPRGVREAADRLRREVSPGAGGEGWTRIERRKREALSRIRAVMRYASSRRCRRRVLLGWFGESAARCGNCDRCGLHGG